MTKSAVCTSGAAPLAEAAPSGTLAARPLPEINAAVRATVPRRNPRFLLSATSISLDRRIFWSKVTICLLTQGVNRG